MVHTIRPLLCLLFLLIALQHYSLAQPDIRVVSAAAKEFVDGVKTARKFGYGRGTKMIVKEVKRKTEIEKMGSKKKNKLTTGKEENISEVDNQVSQHQHLNHYQKHTKKLKGKTEESGILGNPRTSNKNPNYYYNSNSEQDSTKKPTKATSSSKSQSKAEADDNQRLIEATEEMVSLMNKDYAGFKKAKRKPPINNSFPLH